MRGIRNIRRGRPHGEDGVALLLTVTVDHREGRSDLS